MENQEEKEFAMVVVVESSRFGSVFAAAWSRGANRTRNRRSGALVSYALVGVCFCELFLTGAVALLFGGRSGCLSDLLGRAVRGRRRSLLFLEPSDREQG